MENKMTFKMKKLEPSSLADPLNPWVECSAFGKRTRKWEYRGFIIKAVHYLSAPNIVNWSFQEPNGYEWNAKTRKSAKAAIDRTLGE
jgi:hypothetical protein